MRPPEARFAVGDCVEIHFRRQRIAGKIIGIDFYKLETFSGDVFSWPSYTLVSDGKKPFDRFWFVDWGKHGHLLYLATPRIPAGAKPVLNRGGIATIQFQGDQGASTPFAALALHKKDGVYYCAERFSNSEAMLFAGHKIAAPKIVPAL